MLDPLHHLFNHGLMICISSCEGYAGIQMAMQDQSKRPFWALVSNTGKPTWGDACVGYIAFYNLLFKNRPPQHCVEGMRAATGDFGFAFEHGEKIQSDWLARAAMNIAREDRQGTLGSIFASA